MDTDNTTEPKKESSLVKEVLSFIKYSSISVSSVILEYVLFYFLVQLLDNFLEEKLADGIATAFCYLLATIMCHILNKIFVFKSKCKSRKDVVIEGVKYYAVALPKMLITSFCVPLVISLLSIESPVLKTLVNIIVQTVLFFVGYIFQKFWVFKNNKEATQ